MVLENLQVNLRTNIDLQLTAFLKSRPVLYRTVYFMDSWLGSLQGISPWNVSGLMISSSELLLSSAGKILSLSRDFNRFKWAGVSLCRRKGLPPLWDPSVLTTLGSFFSSIINTFFISQGKKCIRPARFFFDFMETTWFRVIRPCFSSTTWSMPRYTLSSVCTFYFTAYMRCHFFLMYNAMGDECDFAVLMQVQPLKVP